MYETKTECINILCCSPEFKQYHALSKFENKTEFRSCIANIPNQHPTSITY